MLQTASLLLISGCYFYYFWQLTHLPELFLCARKIFYDVMWKVLLINTLFLRYIFYRFKMICEHDDLILFKRLFKYKKV